jgi:hypothetical protein
LMRADKTFHFGFHVIAMTAAIFVGVSLMLVVHCAAAEGLKFESIVFDIALFLFSMCIAQAMGLLCLHRIKAVSMGVVCWAVLCTCAVCAVHIVITEHTPHVSWIFGDHRGFYGRPPICNMSTEIATTPASFTTTPTPFATTTPAPSA